MQDTGMSVTVEDILITSGSQQGIDFCGKIFLDEGDAVICESPSYSGALSAFASYLPEFIEIPTDDHGMDMAALEQVLSSRKNVKLIYVIPDFQNPSGRTWSLERRRKLVELAHHYNVLVIEDDPYSCFRFEGTPLPSLMSLDSGNHVIYLGTFSKTLCPGLRTGWLAAGSDVVAKIEIVKQVADIHSNSLAQRQIDKYLEIHGLNDQIERVMVQYKRRKELMLEAMDDFFPDKCNYTRPQGGMFIWVELPDSINARDILLDAVKEKVAFIPGGGFFANSKKENTIRLNYSTMPDDRIREGIQRLGNVLTRALLQAGEIDN